MRRLVVGPSIVGRRGDWPFQKEGGKFHPHPTPKLWREEGNWRWGLINHVVSGLINHACDMKPHIKTLDIEIQRTFLLGEHIDVHQVR